MQKKQRPLKRKVFFNASVVLAGLKSPSGGSAKLLTWSRTKKIDGSISEIVLDEVIRNSHKIGFEEKRTKLWLKSIFGHIHQAPKIETIKKYEKVVIDEGDAHVLASCHELKANFLVTLDKKHLLILKKKIEWLKIVTPGSLIEILSREN